MGEEKELLKSESRLIATTFYDFNKSNEGELFIAKIIKVQNS